MGVAPPPQPPDKQHNFISQFLSSLIDKIFFLQCPQNNHHFYSFFIHFFTEVYFIQKIPKNDDFMTSILMVNFNANFINFTI